MVYVYGLYVCDIYMFGGCFVYVCGVCAYPCTNVYACAHEYGSQKRTLSVLLFHFLHCYSGKLRANLEAAYHNNPPVSAPIVLRL